MNSFPLPSTCTEAQPPFLRISGIYPHLAAWNHGRGPAPGQPCECGIGAVVPWAGRLWFLTYDSHCLHEGDDRLFAVDPGRSIEIHPASIGGTHACRMIHEPSGQLFIGCYAIDRVGRVRVIDRRRLPGRLTAVARHLGDPRRKVYYYTQECSLYEVDVETLEPTLLFVKPLPGWHAKGAYTAQGRLVVAHNGEEVAPSPFWAVDYSDPGATRQLVERYLQVPDGPDAEAMGVLGEFDGRGWRVVSRRQHNDVGGPGGLAGGHDGEQPLWAQGWDRRSLLLHVLYQGGWTRWRLPKGSLTYDGFNGSYTEWPRFREVGEGRWLMTMHGTIFAWPSGFRPGCAGGLEPICTHQRIIPDFCRWGDELVLAGQDASRIGVPWAVPGLPHSNLQFVRPDELRRWGPRSGFGGVWREDAVRAGKASDPFLVAGYDRACLHLAHDAAETVTVALEADAAGGGAWREIGRIAVPPGGLTERILAPADLPAAWIRLRPDHDCRATAQLHLASERIADPGEAEIFAGLPRAASPAGAAMLHVSAHNHDLCVLLRNPDGSEACYEVDERMTFRRLVDEGLIAKLRREAASPSLLQEDAAGLIVVGADGRRFRLPRLPGAASVPWPARRVREVLQERSLANLGGILYEIPRLGVEQPVEQRNLPDYARMRPITAHDRAIADFAIWRGLLVLSGPPGEAPEDGHLFGVPGCRLWFGAIDDLWRLGPPRGVVGPWHDSPVAAGEPSDPCLLSGFAPRELRISHRSRRAVRFRVEVDVCADGIFRPWRELEAGPGETAVLVFPAGWRAHWLRLVPAMATVATAQVLAV